MFNKSTLFIAFTLLSFLSISQHSIDWGYSPTDLQAKGGDVIGEANAQDSDGNVYIVGNFNNTANFDPSSDTKYLTSVGSEDGYIVKYDSLGNLIWVNAIAGSGDNYIYDVTLDSSNNIFITGSFELEADFDPSSNQEIRTATGGFDAYVAKYDSSGGFLWVNVMGGADGTSLTEAGNALAIDQMQDVYVIGRFSNSVDFDPSAATNNLTSIGTDDVFLAKYGNNGNYYWANSFDATQGNGIAIDTANNVCITGAYNTTADFDPGPGNANLTVVLGIDIYLAKYDSNGNYIWAKGLDARAGRDLVIDNSNDIYLLATNQSANSDLDPSAGTALFSPAGGRDVLLAKYNENGDYLWADQVVSGSGFEDAYAIVLSKNQDQVYITGEFEGTTSVGGPSLSSNGGTDIFIASFYTNTGNVSALPQKIGGAGNDTGNDILISSTEKISITGSFESSVDFNPNAGINTLFAPGTLKNAFNAQYTGDGVISHVFANSIGELGNLSSTSQEEGQFVQTDAAGNVYVAGSYEGKIDFGLDSNVYSPLEVDGNAIFIAKLDPNGNLLWANAVIGNSSQILFDLAVDAAGNVYIVGAITGDTDFDAMGGGALTTFNGGADAFLAKYDSNGNYLWSNTIGGSDSETARTAVVNSLGNVVITGTFQSTIDINPAGTPNFIGSVTGNDAFMAEYDGSGVLQWGNVFAGNLIARSMTIDTSDNIFISGDFANTSVDFDPSAGVASFTSTEAYIAKYDAGGNFLWVNPLEGGVYDIGDLEINDNKLFVLGNFNGTMDSDPSIATNTLTSNGSSRDVFLIRFDLDGNHEWAVSFGGTGHETATGIGFYGNNEIYLAGEFYGTTDLDPSTATANYTASFGNSGSDIYISSLDSTGNFLWALSPSKSSSVQLRHLSTDNFGNVFVTGSFSNLGFDVDPSANSSYIFAQNSLDAHVIKYRRPCVTVSSTYTVNACDSYTWIDGNTYTTNNNTATHTVVTPGACDTLYTLDLTINGANSGTDIVSACDSYLWIDGNTYTSSNNTATFTLTNAAGCDSVVTLDLTINNSTTGTDVQTACDSYTWIDGNTYTTSNNTATVTLTNAVGCDSIVTLNLTINNSSTGTDVITACDSYTWIDGNTYTSSNNTATVTLTNVVGCDSIVTLDLTINNSSTGTDVITACDSFTWIDGNTYTSSNNTATFTLTNAAGCDSIVTLDLTINNSSTGTDVITACDSYTWIDGNTYTSSNNTATVTLSNAAGCDSVVTLDLTINNSTTATDVVTSCENYYTWINGVTYIADNNTATYTTPNAVGCDSIITLDLTFLTAASGIDVQAACGTYTWIDGNTYAASTNTPTYTIVGGGANGCDSIVTLDLTINNPSTGTDVITACESYTWIDGNTYTASNNTATYALTNAAGCDSVVTLDLTINNSSIGTDVQTACDSYTWIDGNTYTTSNNTATVILTNAAGCDSIVTLDLTINNPSTGTDVITTCESYTWIDGNTYTSSNNTATVTLTSAVGCDSIVTLNLTINNSSTGTDVITACDSYTWIDGNTYTASNNTATWTLTNAAGCDSIITLDLTINNSNTGTDVITACDSYTWIDGNTYTSSNNIATFTLTNAVGCDSIVTLDLTINNSNTGTDIITACDSYTWIDGNTYTASNNTAIFTLTNVAGCDSIVTLDLTITNSTTGTDVITACGSYTWMDGTTYYANNNSATFVFNGGAANGCDSIVTLNLTVNPMPNTDVDDQGITLVSQDLSASYQWLDCNNGFTEISGETFVSYTPDTTGSYAVKLDLAGCVDTSVCFFVDYSDLEEISDIDFKLYPNPTNELFTVEFADAQGKVEFKLLSTTGQLIELRTEKNFSSVQFNITSEPGVYFLEITFEDERKAVLPVIKQ